MVLFVSSVSALSHFSCRGFSCFIIHSFLVVVPPDLPFVIISYYEAACLFALISFFGHCSAQSTINEIGCLRSSRQACCTSSFSHFRCPNPGFPVLASGLCVSPFATFCYTLPIVITNLWLSLSYFSYIPFWIHGLGVDFVFRSPCEILPDAYCRRRNAANRFLLL